MAVSHSPVFRQTLRQITAGEILAPAAKAYLMDPNFKGFSIDVHGIGTRPYDGLFHPSGHPSMPERALFLYLTAPDLLIPEPMNPMAVLSMTAGSIWHAIMGRILHDELGLVSSLEVRVSDDATGSVGAMDGVITMLEGSHEIYELKTMKDMALSKLVTVEDYIQKYPTYYLQAQEYMRMSGYRKERVLIMALTYPYDMKEFVIEYDPMVSNAIRDKYLRVRQAAADQRMPECSGCAKNSECPARAVCKELAK